jgi:hypothetical protein
VYGPPEPTWRYTLLTVKLAAGRATARESKGLPGALVSRETGDVARKGLTPPWQWQGGSSIGRTACGEEIGKRGQHPEAPFVGHPRVSEAVVAGANVNGSVPECPIVADVHTSEETDSEFQERIENQNGRSSRCGLDHNRAAAIGVCGFPALQQRPQVQCEANTNALAGGCLSSACLLRCVRTTAFFFAESSRCDWFTGHARSASRQATVQPPQTVDRQ